ncbi:MAG: hypothetical protein J5934_06305 [Succinivibrio sp.]|nr:hypothetical protein [Succinivibrio sp.]
MLNVSVTLDNKTLKKIEADVINKRQSSVSEITNSKDTVEEDYLKPEDTATHIGEFRQVCGTVIQSYERKDYGFINFGDAFPNQNFVIFITS